MQKIRLIFSWILIASLVLLVPASTQTKQAIPERKLVPQVVLTADSTKVTQWALEQSNLVVAEKQRLDEEAKKVAEAAAAAALAAEVAKAQAEEARVNRVAFPFHQDGWYITTEYAAVDALHPNGHSGLDIGNGPSFGWKAYPIARGVVIGTYSYSGSWPGCGNYVVVWHEQLNLTTMYCHLASIEVGEGQWLDPDVPLGEVGTTGYSDGIHLHLATASGYGVDNQGTFLNPRDVLATYGIFF